MAYKKRSLLIFSLATTLALPALGAIYNGPPPYGEIVLRVEDHFALSDADGSGTLTMPEYAAISHRLKNQPAQEARKDFIAMDMNGDGLLTLDEFFGEMPSTLTL